MDEKNILIVGPGALGAGFAARLAEAGHQVTVACRTGRTAEHIRRHGVVAVDPEGKERHAGVAALVRPKELPGTDLMILATKCADAEAALAAWLPKLPRTAKVVAVQNGILGDQLKQIAKSRLLECTVAYPATLEGPGRSVQTGPGDLILGPWPRTDSQRVLARSQKVADILEAVVPSRISGNMRGIKWTKLLINSCITSLGALTGAGLPEVLGDRRGRKAYLAIIREGYKIGKAAGVEFETVRGFRPAFFAGPMPGRRTALRIMARKYRRYRSSSLQSLERGQRTEVHYLNGAIVARAQDLGLAAPFNAAVVAAVKRVEEGELKPDLGNLAHLPI